MTTTQSAATCFVRPIRPDVLQRAASKLRPVLVTAGVPRADAASLSRAIVSTARLSRSYIDGVRALLRARSSAALVKALDGLRGTTGKMQERMAETGPALAHAVESAGNGADATALIDAWFEGGGPEELSAEGRLRLALTERLSSMGPVRVSDIAHLACLWSDSQRFHAALRGALRGSTRSSREGRAFLQGVSTMLADHVLPVDLVGLPGDPGLLEGIPKMIARFGGTAGRRR